MLQHFSIRPLCSDHWTDQLKIVCFYLDKVTQKEKWQFMKFIIENVL